MSHGFVERICTKCWGKPPSQYGALCSRCKGSGEEPDFFNGWMISLAIAIFVIGLYFVWGVPTS